MKKADVQQKVRVAAEDVDDVVEIAMRMMQSEEGQLSIEELREIGEELDIPPELLDRAHTELQLQRAQTHVQRRENAIETREVMRNVFVGITGLGAALCVWSMAAVSTLADLNGVLEAQAAQVTNVTERRASVLEHYKGRPASRDKDAEVVGAEERVVLESEKYTELAVRYNVASQKFPVGIMRDVMGLPGSVPTKAP